MRLLTHNQLVCVRKGCASHYPLQLRASAVEKSGDASVDSDGDEEEQEVDTEEEVQAKLDFVIHLLPNVDYAVLGAAAASVSQQQQRAAAAVDAHTHMQSEEGTQRSDGDTLDMQVRASHLHSSRGSRVHEWPAVPGAHRPHRDGSVAHTSSSDMLLTTPPLVSLLLSLALALSLSLCLTLPQLGLSGLPASLPDVSTLDKSKDAELLKKLHEVLVEVRSKKRRRGAKRPQGKTQTQARVQCRVGTDTTWRNLSV